MLYTLSNSPYACDLSALLSILRLNDCLLLLADGVIAGLHNSVAYKLLSTAPVTIYALSNDIIARGLTKCYSRTITIISYTKFVILTEQQSPHIAW